MARFFRRCSTARRAPNLPCPCQFTQLREAAATSRRKAAQERQLAAIARAAQAVGGWVEFTLCRLRLVCADQLAVSAMGDDDEAPAVVEEMPRRPNPVTQDEMDAASIELF